MLYIFCGLPRNGKSVLMTRNICIDLDNMPYSTIPIYVNWDITYTTYETYQKMPFGRLLRIPKIFRKLPFFSFETYDIIHSTHNNLGRLRKYENFEDLLDINFPCDIYIDEMGGLLFNRDWKSIPSGFIKYLQQHGKKGIDIIGATQSIDSIEVNFRRLAAGIAIVSKVFQPSIFKRSRTSQHKGFPLFKTEVVHRHPYLGDKDEKIALHNIFWARKKYLLAFDTKQDIVTKTYPVVS